MILPRDLSDAESPAEPSRAFARAHRPARARSRERFALMVFSAGYPLLGLALWVGAGRGHWKLAAIIVALAIIMSFYGWLLLYRIRGERGDDPDLSEPRERATSGRLFVALYGRVGAILLIFGSYAAVGAHQGWPLPEVFLASPVLAWFLVIFAIALLSSALP